MHEIQLQPQGEWHPLTIDLIDQADAATLKAEFTKGLERLGRQLAASAETYAYLARIWRRGEELGVDMSEFEAKKGLIRYIPAVAAGRLAEELVVHCAGQSMLIEALSEMPVESQREIIRQGTVKMVTLDDYDEPVIKDRPLTSLKASDIRFVFDKGRIRTTAEQIEQRKKALRLAQEAAKKPLRARKVSVQDEQVIIGDRAASVDKVLESLSDYYEVPVAQLIRDAMEAKPEVKTAKFDEIARKAY